MQSNTFDEVLGLEEQFYEDGYQQGLSDGVKAGRIEGRTFGLEKGYEKYVDSGKLYGKSLVWANRMSHIQRLPISTTQTSVPPVAKSSSSPQNSESKVPYQLPRLPDNARLSRHIKTLHALAESESLSTENTEEAVSDFDDRSKRAHGKAKIIERMAGEARGDSDGQGKSSNDGSIEDVSVLKARH